MLFTSLEFVLLFLPIVLIGYFEWRRELRNLWLLTASLVFYAWGEPKFVVVMTVLVIINYFIVLKCVCGITPCHPGNRFLAVAVAKLAYVKKSEKGSPKHNAECIKAFIQWRADCRVNFYMCCALTIRTGKRWNPLLAENAVFYKDIRFFRMHP